MRTINFEFIKPRFSILAELGGFAEQYSQPDPVSALVKLRMFAEQLVWQLYENYRLPQPVQPNLYDLIKNPAFEAVIPRAVAAKLDAIRIHGNKAAHGNEGSIRNAVWLLKEAHGLACWLYIAVAKGKREDCPEFRYPPAGLPETKALQQEKKQLQKQLQESEARLQQLLDELEQNRSRAETAEQELTETTKLAVAAEQAAEQLHFSEAKTRRELIDSLLRDAGWPVGENGASTESVVQEMAAGYALNQSGQGYADYVLMDDNGKPLAVIEAKKTASSAEAGREQVRFYADGLEQKFGQRPLLFFTNGYDIYIWNDFSAIKEPPRKLYGFYSKDSLQYLLFQFGDIFKQVHKIFTKCWNQAASHDRLFETLTYRAFRGEKNFADQLQLTMATN